MPQTYVLHTMLIAIAMVVGIIMFLRMQWCGH